jgi:hypothetical protein
MTLNDILQKALGIFKQPELISPVPPEQTMGHPSYIPPTPQPTPTPTPQMWRNPRMDEFRQKTPGSFAEIQSGVELATEDELRRQILMDIALEEAGMQTHPPANPQSSAAGPYQYIKSTAEQMGIDPLNATESARATNEALDNRNLHWWEVLHKGGATGTPLDKLYSPEELNQFLREERRF